MLHFCVFGVLVDEHDYMNMIVLGDWNDGRYLKPMSNYSGGTRHLMSGTTMWGPISSQSERGSF